MNRLLRVAVLALAGALAFPHQALAQQRAAPTAFSLSAAGQISANLDLSTGLSSCSVTVNNSGTGQSLVPEATSDGSIWNTVTTIGSGSITTFGLYTGSVSGTGLGQFHVRLATLSSGGPVTGTVICTSAVSASGGSGGVTSITAGSNIVITGTASVPIVSVVSSPTFGPVAATSVTAANLTSGNCVQASTAGLLTTTSGPCGGGAPAYDALIKGTTGIVHYWPMNDALGATAAADAVGAVNLTANGNVAFGGLALTRDGESSASFPQQGTSDYLTFPNGLIPALSTITVEFVATFSWVPSSVNASQPYFFSSDTTPDFGLIITTSGYVQYITTGAAFVNVAIAPPPTQRVLYDIVFNTASSNTLSVYANCIRVYQQVSATAPSQLTDGKIGVDAQIGASAEQALGGNVSKFAIYSTALSQTQINARCALL